MKILIASSLHPVDDPRVFHKEAVSLAKEHEVHLAAVAHGRSAAPGVELHPFKRSAGRIRGTLQAYQAITRVFRRLRPDVVHFHDPDLVPLCLWLCLFTRSKVVYDIHEDVTKTIVKKRWLPGPLKRPLGWMFGKIEVFAASRFDAVVLAEPYALDRFGQINAVIVRNFAPLVEAPRRIPFSDDRPIRLIYVGGLAETRGILTLIEALDLTRVKAELHLAGRFYSEDFRKRVLTDRPDVHYHGVLSFGDVFNLLLQADIGMNCIHSVPSHVESLATKVFEYMAAGLPIITSDFPIWREIVEGAGCGVCVDPSDARAIARAVDDLARVPSQLTAMGQTARGLHEKKYNWSLEEKNLFEVYSRLERGKGRKGEKEKRTKGKVQSAIRNPTVSVVIPMRNERGSIEANLRALAANDLPREKFEVIVVDGMSEDGSAELAESLIREMGNGRVLKNPKRTTPVALNMGVEAAGGDIIIILGAHSAVFPDFLSKNLEALERTGADCVGGTLIHSSSDTLLANVINVAQNCPFGSGGAGFRYSDKPGDVSTVPFGAYRREVFDKIGGFDEALHKGQDAEFNFRMVESGLKIYYSPEIKTYYFSRSSLRRLFKQFLAMGWSKVFIFYLLPRLLKAYYYLPLLFTVGVIIVLLRLFWASKLETLVYLCAGVAYVALSVGSGLAFSRRKGIMLQSRAGAAALFPVCFFLMHFGYGLGIIKGLAELAFSFGKRAKRRKGEKAKRGGE